MLNVLFNSLIMLTILSSIIGYMIMFRSNRYYKQHIKKKYNVFSDNMNMYRMRYYMSNKNETFASDVFNARNTAG